MPILDVEVVVAPDEPLPPPELAPRLADAAGAVLGTPPGRTWLRLRTLARERYAESGGGPPPGVLPVFVSVLALEPPSGDELAARVGALARAVGEATRRPAEHVHVVYEPSARGRIAFGGVPFSG